MDTTPYQLRNDKLGPRIADALKKRHFEAWYCADPADALKQVFDLIPQSDTVSWGGSVTAETLGIQKTLRERGYTVIDRDTAQSKEERTELMRQALLCDTFITSSNAVTEDGQLVNVDGNGNRVAAMCFGPRSVIVVAGMNKVVKTLEDAVQRARTIAGPINMQRFPALSAPCSVNGACANCSSLDSICSYIVTTRLCKPAGRIKVILIGGEFGF
ncbi:lactate utilization protein [Breznakiella homolactica]|uniref:Lactate utilization protein n=1 Tax=Breznakiella homolactica TaxID=2798577 RepID=A0A7T8BAR6_9SPIR|nr:lactate utilization protein [Breznakiella homolactica]QQO09666.1 lactate utilization protein [Breznakiella homolactica]